MFKKKERERELGLCRVTDWSCGHCESEKLDSNALVTVSSTSLASTNRRHKLSRGAGGGLCTSMRSLGFLGIMPYMTQCNTRSRRSHTVLDIHVGYCTQKWV